MTACVLICAAALSGVPGCGSSSEPQKPVTPASTPAQSVAPSQAPAKAASTPPKRPRQIKKQAAAPPAKPVVVDDDGRSPWVSPTHGPAINLGWLSPGAQVITVLRPAVLVKNPEGDKIRAALGPLGKDGIDFVERVTKMSLANMDQLIIGGRAASDGAWQLTFVVRPTRPIPAEALSKHLENATKKEVDDKTYWLAGDRAYYAPASANGNVLVIAPPDAIEDIISLAGSPPPLRRDIERLLAHTDADRQATFIFAPNALFSEGQTIFSGEMAGLRQPLFAFLGDELSSAALSLNWGNDFYLELIATPTLETLPERAAVIFDKRVEEIPPKVEAYVASLQPHPYGRELVTRLPAMLKKLVAYTRTSYEPDHMVLRCYLPLAAGHNLLIATELALAESQRVGKLAGGHGAAANDSTGGAPTVSQALAKTTSLRFTKDTLEAALEQLSQDIGVPIVIRGPDLQAEGITKNQSFGIDLSNKPAGEILIQVLRLANPDKSATSASDKRQKLVYIVEQKPDKSEQIVITTRTRANERHDQLPEAFQAAKP